jgi:hypothetical protein
MTYERQVKQVPYLPYYPRNPIVKHVPYMVTTPVHDKSMSGIMDDPIRTVVLYGGAAFILGTLVWLYYSYDPEQMQEYRERKAERLFG